MKKNKKENGKCIVIENDHDDVLSCNKYLHSSEI